MRVAAIAAFDGLLDACAVAGAAGPADTMIMTMTASAARVMLRHRAGLPAAVQPGMPSFK
jgi:hypothetical protein